MKERWRTKRKGDQIAKTTNNKLIVTSVTGLGHGVSRVLELNRTPTAVTSGSKPRGRPHQQPRSAHPFPLRTTHPRHTLFSHVNSENIMGGGKKQIRFTRKAQSLSFPVSATEKCLLFIYYSESKDKRSFTGMSLCYKVNEQVF